MNKRTDRRHIGLNFSGEIAEISVWAPNAEKVGVQLTGKEYLALRRADFGYWLGSSSSIKPGDLYTIDLGKGEKFPDPASLAQPEGVHGPSMAVDLTAFEWTDDNWKNIPLDEYILYELHTGTFSQEGDFAAIEQKLDYLLKLGITAIEIMPVAQFPGERNWGYDGVHPFAVQDSYGGVAGLQKLVDTCHAKGMAVILDVVYNHLGPEGNYLGNFGPFFTDKYNTPWGNAINFDDAGCDAVRDYFIENALMWFRDFHIDALRLDAVHAIKDFSPVHILKEIKLKVDELNLASARSHYLIVELDLNDNRFIKPLDQDGFGMDAQWVDEFHHALRTTAGEGSTGYYSDFNGISHLAKSYQDAYVYDGQYSPHRDKKFGVKADDNPGKQFIVFSQNHDQVGNRMLGERTSDLLSFEMQKLLAAAVIFSPYLPMLFMGEEWAEPNPFQYFVSHTDPDLAEAVRKGRKEEFAAFHSAGEAPDPMSEETFIKSKLQWEIINREPHQTMLNYYRRLISLRKALPALNHLNRKHLRVSFDEAKKTLILRRWHKELEVVCFMNFSNSNQTVQASSASDKWYLLLNSASSEWKGSASNAGKVSSKEDVTIPPEAILVYTNDKNIS